MATKISEIKKWNKPVICSCASGMSSDNASVILNGYGIENMNGGGWASLYKKPNVSEQKNPH